MNRSTVLVCALSVLTLLSGTQSLRASWVQDGVPICTAGGFQHDPWIVPDGAGGAILVWLDARNVTVAVYYAQRVNAAGDVLWAIDGVPLCTAVQNQENAQIVQDGAGGAIVAWQDSRNGGWDIYAQRIASNGNLEWTSGGAAVCTSAAQQWTPQLVQDGAGGAIVVWCECVENAGCCLRAQRLDAEGNSVWTTDGALVSGVLSDNVTPRVVSDGAGGAIVVWDSALRPDGYVHAQRIDSEGNALWTAGGVTISSAPREFSELQLIRDGAGGAIAVWRDWGGGVGDTAYLRAQRFNASGEILWASDGIVVCPVHAWQDCPQLAEDGSGGAIAVWDDGRNGIDYDVYAQKIDGNGTLVWPASGAAVCAAPNHQWYPQIVGDGAGGAIVAWEEVRGATEDIFAQRVDAGGAVLWTPGGIIVCGAQGNQGGGVRLTRDGSGGAICAWMDARNGIDDGIYAQRIGANGEIPMATQLQSCAAVCSKGIITLTWTVSECGRSLEFRVLRAEGSSGVFSEVHSPCMSTERLSFAFTDSDGQPGSTYRYRVEYRDTGSWSILFESDLITIPALPLALFQNVPNPFNPSTTISYYLPENCAVTIDVYDVSGKRVARLVSGEESRGQHSAAWKGMDDEGKRLSSGVYIYRLTADRQTISKKMVLLR